MTPTTTATRSAVSTQSQKWASSSLYGASELMGVRRTIPVKGQLARSSLTVYVRRQALLGVVAIR